MWLTWRCAVIAPSDTASILDDNSTDLCSLACTQYGQTECDTEEYIVLEFSSRVDGDLLCVRGVSARGRSSSPVVYRPNSDCAPCTPLVPRTPDEQQDTRHPGND